MRTFSPPFNGYIMTLYKFKKLSEIEQTFCIWEAGAFVAHRLEGEHKIILFQLSAFYVEVYYNIVTKSFGGLRPFESTHQLKPYLEEIDISALFDQLH